MHWKLAYGCILTWLYTFLHSDFSLKPFLQIIVSHEFEADEFGLHIRVLEEKLFQHASFSPIKEDNEEELVIDICCDSLF